MKILILDAGEGISVIARTLLQQFDRYMIVSAASVRTSTKTDTNPVIRNCIAELGISEPLSDESVGQYLKEPWDYILVVSKEIKSESLPLTSRVKHRIDMLLDFSLAGVSGDSQSREFCIPTLHELKNRLYTFYLHHISEPQDEQTCPCGANRSCRCF